MHRTQPAGIKYANKNYYTSWQYTLMGKAKIFHWKDLQMIPIPEFSDKGRIQGEKIQKPSQDTKDENELPIKEG